MTRMLVAGVSVLWLLLDLGCEPSGGGGEATGSEGGACYGNGTCDPGLECRYDVCVGVSNTGDCNSGEFDCGNGKCVPLNWICDGDNDCGNDADEKGCACQPNCNGRECGPEPGCGKSCGTCTGGETCNANGQCVSEACVPICSGRECGLDPVCGESCGTCTGGKTCSATGQCVSEACVPICGSRECGPDPVCGELCGTCSGDSTCNSSGQCVAEVCVPSCGGRECGPDPVCGESCGACGSGEECKGSSGQCFAIWWYDSSSGRIWENPPSRRVTNLWDAESYCASLSLDGGGWRVPSISELRSLIRGCPATEVGGSCGVTDSCRSWDDCSNASCTGCEYDEGPSDGCYWPSALQGDCKWYWSSTLVSDGIDTGLEVGFFNGAVDLGDVEGGYVGYAGAYVRCVR